MQSERRGHPRAFVSDAAAARDACDRKADQLARTATPTPTYRDSIIRTATLSRPLTPTPRVAHHRRARLVQRPPPQRPPPRGVRADALSLHSDGDGRAAAHDSDLRRDGAVVVPSVRVTDLRSQHPDVRGVDRLSGGLGRSSAAPAAPSSATTASARIHRFFASISTAGGSGARPHRSQQKESATRRSSRRRMVASHSRDMLPQSLRALSSNQTTEYSVLILMHRADDVGRINLPLGMIPISSTAQ